MKQRLKTEENARKLMNNPFQEQLLKAGVVSKQQVQKANKDKQKKKKQIVTVN